jgi:predicted ester cyclase
MHKIGQIFRFLIPVIALVALVVFMTGAAKRRMTKKEFVAAYRQWEEAWSTNNPDLLDKTIAPDCITHIPPSPDIKSLQAYKQQIRDTLSAFPDYQATHHRYIFDGKWGATLWSWTGTNKDTGKKVKVTGACITKWVDGKCVEHWTFADNLGLQEQLGFKLVPAGK